MGRNRKTGWLACAGAAAVAIGLAGCSDTAGKGGGGPDRIVAPSQYVEDIESEGSTGGVEDEADAAAAQAESAEKAAKAAAEKARKKTPSVGGW